MVTKLQNLKNLSDRGNNLIPVYARYQMEHPVPRYELADQELRPNTAYDLILDGNARLNLATFVTTWMEPEAEKLMAETFDKNMIDKDEYPFTAMIEERCLNIVSRLFNALARAWARPRSALRKR